MLGATVADRVKKSAVFCENAANICFEKSEKQWLGTVNRCGRRSWRRDDLIAPGSDHFARLCRHVGGQLLELDGQPFLSVS